MKKEVSLVVTDKADGSVLFETNAKIPSKLEKITINIVVDTSPEEPTEAKLLGFTPIDAQGYREHSTKFDPCHYHNWKNMRSIKKMRNYLLKHFEALQNLRFLHTDSRCYYDIFKEKWDKRAIKEGIEELFPLDPGAQAMVFVDSGAECTEIDGSDCIEPETAEVSGLNSYIRKIIEFDNLVELTEFLDDLVETGKILPKDSAIITNMFGLRVGVELSFKQKPFLDHRKKFYMMINDCRELLELEVYELVLEKYHDEEKVTIDEFNGLKSLIESKKEAFL